MKQQDFSVPARHPVFAGHFPGRPIVPGVMLLDAAVHAIAGDRGPVGAWQVGSVKFLSPLLPDEAAVISWEAQAAGVRFDIAAAGRMIASGSLVLRGDA